MSNSFPPQGQMVLYSSATPPLQDGSYQLTVETDVSYNPSDNTADAPPAPLLQDHYFNVVGPRFSIPPGLVAGVFPPNNAHGTFQDDLPHIVIGRRTLPWEREIAQPGQIPVTPVGPNDPPALTDPFPWVALLLFEEGEYTLLRNIPLEQAVPQSVFVALGSPANITCDAVQADALLVAAIMPTYEELQLLVHVRQVNTDDRELNAYGGDGFFSVVVANRLPSPNTQCRAILVSLEQRTDLIPQDLAVSVGLPGQLLAGATVTPVTQIAAEPAAVEQPPLTQSKAALPFTLTNPPAHLFESGNLSRIGFPVEAQVRLVALTSWQFTCEGPGTFRELMQGLNDAMFGTVAQPGQPALTDTGHMPITLQDRAGMTENVLYRGPLVQFQLTRDTLGPYHSADQARRVAPESGTEDISFAAAFEAGRLMAVADGRLAQALMQWRRESYKQSARATTITALAQRVTLDLPATLADQLHTPITPLAATAATTAVSTAHLPLGDPYGLARVAGVPGLNPTDLAATWGLSSAAAASALLGGNPGSLGAAFTAPPQTPRADTTIGAVAADTTSSGQAVGGTHPGRVGRHSDVGRRLMRISWVTGHQALAERMVAKDQIDATVPEAAMPLYMELFLAHLRLLVGVPFDYLVPDARLLPNESIRFFYLDRSWTDRLVDGAIAVGKIGTREQTHHQAHAANIQSQLDMTERIVRIMQRGLPANSETAPGTSNNTAPGGIVSGFLLRSAAVSGWPSMDVRAFNTVLSANEGDPNDANYQAWLKQAAAAQLTTLRLELLSPSVMLALFDGIPQLVWCEEPHHGVQFGFTLLSGVEHLDRHMADGATEPTGAPIAVPMRANAPRVVAIRALRAAIYQLQAGDPNLIPQNSSADFAIELLNYPWRQRFQDAGGGRRNNGAFVPRFAVASTIANATLQTTVTELV